METQPEQLEPSPNPGNADSKRDFWIGFIGWWVFNVCAGAMLYGIGYGSSMLAAHYSYDDTLFLVSVSCFGCLVLLINIAALIFFAFRRKLIALGMLVAFGASIAISLLAGIIYMVACFIIVIDAYNRL